MSRMDCGLRRNDEAGGGGARAGWLSGRPVRAVEHDRGWGGTWLAGWAWWDVSLTPRPPLHHVERGCGFPPRIGVRDMLSRE